VIARSEERLDEGASVGVFLGENRAVVAPFEEGFGGIEAESVFLFLWAVAFDAGFEEHGADIFFEEGDLLFVGVGEGACAEGEED
jgi:hypothetical protein